VCFLCPELRVLMFMLNFLVMYVIYAAGFLFYMNNSVRYTVMNCERNKFIIKNMLSTIQKQHALTFT